MAKDVSLGIDLGTTTVKIVAMRSSDESVIGSWSCETKASVLSDAEPLASEQDVSKIMSAIDNCVAEIPPNLAARISGIGVSGQMHGLVMWTKQSGNIGDQNSSSSSSSSSFICSVNT